MTTMIELPQLTGADRARIEEYRIDSIERLHEVNGTPHPKILSKHTPQLTPLMADFIACCPYLLIATSAEDGSTDVSPRGDNAGFVKVLDEQTIAIPDRPGNRRVDSHRNILSRPYVGTIFLVPAVDETLRINGRAMLTTDPQLLAEMAVGDKLPKLAVIVEIDEAYMHCARSILRSGIWEPNSWPDPNDVPTARAIGSEQHNLPAPDESGGKRQEEYRTRLY